jgi:hypothetical protein
MTAPLVRKILYARVPAIRQKLHLSLCLNFRDQLCSFVASLYGYLGKDVRRAVRYNPKESVN